MKKRTMYSMHHYVATQGLFGCLVPTMRMEVAPGDTWSGRIGMLIRFSPFKKPLVHDLLVDQYVFYVPHRLVWDQWEDFIAAGPNPDTPIPVPARKAAWFSGFQAHDQSVTVDPDGGDGSRNWNALYLRAYNLCWNEFFRDQNLHALVGPDDVPKPQGTTGTQNIDVWSVASKPHWTNLIRLELEVGTAATAPVVSNAVSAADILKAIAEQKLQMKRQTYGTRYVDILRSYGVSVNYAMLQRPELVGVSHSTLNITDVVSTDSSQLGVTAGYGVSGARLRLRRRSFPEHGTLLGLVVIRPPFIDQSTIDYLDRDPTYASFYDPQLELLPPMPIQLRDVLGTTFNNNATAQNSQIGFAPWGQHYRFALSRSMHTMGDFVTGHWNTALGSWKNSPPVSGSNNYLPELARIQSKSYDTVFTQTTEGHYQLAVVNGLRAARLIQRQPKSILSGTT